MSRNVHILVVLVLLLLLLAACGPSKAEILAQTATAQFQSMGTSTANAEATAEQQAAIAAQTEAAVSATAESIASATAARQTQQVNAQNTLQAATQQYIASSTAEASGMYNLVSRLYEGDFITTTEGNYVSFPDYTESFAQINWIRIAPVNFEVYTNFVLKVRIGWESATKTNNITNSGCGIAFRTDMDYKYYAFLLALDKKMAYIRNLQDSPYLSLSKRYFGEFDYMAGEAIVIITAEGPILQVFDEGLNRIDRREDNKLESGFFSYALASGETQSFGTRCTFTEMELWDLGD